VRGELAEGARLPPDSELSVQLGVGRPAVRQALLLLEREGLVAQGRGRTGARVQAPGEAFVAHLVATVLEHRRVPLSDVADARSLLETKSRAATLAGRGHETLAFLTCVLARVEHQLGGSQGVDAASTRHEDPT
jgi:DNA-binding FadR family transcriptional regulator